jgi:hypothetical protein
MSPEEKKEEQVSGEIKEGAREAPKEEVKKGDSHQAKSTVPQKPTECAACAKALKKKLWYYRNGAFFCTAKCYKRKTEEDRKKAEEASKK